LTLRLPDNGADQRDFWRHPDLLLGPRDRSGPKRTGFGICAEDSAQALIAGAGPGSGDPLKGGARSASSRDLATAARIARIAPGSSTVAIKRRRPPQRGHARTSISNARLIKSAHAQCRAANDDGRPFGTMSPRTDAPGSRPR